MAFLLFEKIKEFFSDKEAKELKTAIDNSDLINKNQSYMTGQNPITIEDDILNYDPFQLTTITGQNLLINLEQQNQKIKEWRMMAEIPEVDDAIDIIINEMISFDGINDPIDINLDNLEIPKNIKNKIQESFDKCMTLLKFNEHGYKILRQWYIDGQINYKVIYDEKNKKNGIIDLIKLTPFYFYKYIDSETDKIYWFYAKQNFSNIATGFKNSTMKFLDEEIIHADSGKYSFDGKFPVSFLNNAIKPINQLTLNEDSLVIYRITRATERRVFYVDVGNLPKNKAEQYVQNLIRKYRQKKVYNLETGRIEGATKTLSILEDFWFPVAQNRGSRVETLAPGNLTFTDIDDIKYFIKKVYQALKVPWTRKEAQSSVNFSASAEIERDEIRFTKFIIRLRNEFKNLILDFLKRDLLYTNTITYDDWKNIKNNIKFIFNTDNDYAEIKNLDKWGNRFELVDRANNLIQDGYLSKKWVFKNILKFTDEDIEQIKKEIEEEKLNEEEYQKQIGFKP